MVTLPATGSFDYAPGTRHNSDMPGTFAGLLEFVRALFGGADEQVCTIGSGAIAPSQASVILDTSGGPANLDAIATTSLPLGFPLFVRPADPSRVPTVRHGRGTTAQILLANGADLPLVSTTQLLVLQRKNNGWREVWRNYGTAEGSFRSFYGLSAAAAYPAATQTQAIAGVDDPTAGPVLITALRLRQVLTDKSWLQALTAFTGTYDPTKWLLYDDGTNPPWRLPGIAALAGAPYQPFVASGLAVGAGDSGIYTHGLGAAPRLVVGELACVADDVGFSAANGDRTAPADGIGLWWHGTQLGYGSSGTVHVRDAGDGTLRTIAPAKWTLAIRAWR